MNMSFLIANPKTSFFTSILKGEWGVTASEEEEMNKRIKEFQDSIPKMCSQLRLLTHFYQVF